MSAKIGKAGYCALALIFFAGCEKGLFEARPEKIKMAEPEDYEQNCPVDPVSALEGTFSQAFNKIGVLGGNLDLHGFILVETDRQKLSRKVVLGEGITSYKDFVIRIVRQTDFRVSFVDQVAIITPSGYKYRHSSGKEKPTKKEYFQMEIPFLTCRELSAHDFSEAINNVSISLADYYAVPPLLVDRNDHGVSITAVFVYLPIRDIPTIMESF